MGKIKNILGIKFGRLTVVEFIGEDKQKQAVWRCVCDCGNECETISSRLITGQTKSCGCISKEILHNRNYKDGRTKEKLYKRWKAMKDRCNTNGKQKHKNYGERGISVCEEWHDYTKFRKWAIENGYMEGLTIDRIDVNGDYCPENCRWVNNEVQCNNKRNSIYIELNGETKTIGQWIKIFNIKDKKKIYRKYHRGLTPKKIFEEYISTNMEDK